MTNQELDIINAYINDAREDAERAYQKFYNRSCGVDKDLRARMYAEYKACSTLVLRLECLAADLKRGHL